MKKITVFSVLTICFSSFSFCQIKITRATQQKTFGGMGGISMNYIIDFNDKQTEKIEIDSISAVADSASIKFGFTKFDPCCKNEISFSYALSAPARCRTCPKVGLQPYNLTKGAIIYYRSGERKNFVKVKKFKELPDLKLP